MSAPRARVVAQLCTVRGGTNASGAGINTCSGYLAQARVRSFICSVETQ